MSADTPTRRPSQMIPLALIDEPDLPMRATMSDDGLDSLAESMRELGQLQELVVVAAADRFRVAAGHRRRIALERAAFTEARCIVFPEGTPLEEAIKVAENDEKEPVNAAAQAKYYRYLLDHRFAGDVARLSTFLKRPQSTVLDYLDLTQKDPDVFDALGAGVITMAVARELNKVRLENYRRLFLHDAVQQGATSTTVKRWHDELRRTLRVNEALANGGAEPIAPANVTPVENLDACRLCLTSDDQNEMIYVKVHRSCADVHRRNLLSSVKA